MTIKEQAYRAHAFLQARGVASLKRSHLHELLAATAGYATHAAFQHDATWCDVPFSLTGIESDLDLLAMRCAELGLPADDVRRVVEALPRFQHDAGYAPLQFEGLIEALDGDEDDAHGHEWVWTHVVEPMQGGIDFAFEHHRVLLEGLETAAGRGIPSAHLAIAKLLEPEATWSDDDDERVRRHVRRDGTWLSPFVSFAEVEADRLRCEAKHRHHLLAAAGGGDLRALMETAERYGDPAILEREPSETMDARNMADVAAEHGDYKRLRYWLTIAARRGDTDAMRELILEHGEAPDQAWTWMHLSRLLGEDLAEDRFKAIHEDGTSYDDDLGGPVYVGGVEGIHLEPLPAEADATARRMAVQLFAEIEARSDSY